MAERRAVTSPTACQLDHFRGKLKIKELAVDPGATPERFPPRNQPRATVGVGRGGAVAERSGDWMAQARRDLESARWQAEGGFHEWACFAAHQAAEKAVKAVYEWMGGVAWGHSVVSLLTGLEARAEATEDIVEAARRLDRLYLPTRYPNGWDRGTPGEHYTAEDAKDAIGGAGAVLRFCEGVLAGPPGGAPAAP